MRKFTGLWFLLCFLFGLLPFRSFSQTVLEGVVLEDETGKGAGAYVLVRPPGEPTLAVGYVATGENGWYRLEFNSSLDSLDLCINGLGLKSQTKRIPNRNGRYDFRLLRSTFRLKEVKVQAPKVSTKGRDTVVYNVQALKTDDDRVLEDVIKRIPGIRVRNNGQISYKGTPVDVTIEGMDLLKGRYGIATKNIAPEHISTVEILENHQAVKALEGLMPSDKTTLNLRLKESSKGVFLASLAAGGGYDGGGLWEGEGAGMYFGHRSQHVVTLKANNIGRDLRYELANHSGSGASSLNPTLSRPLLASPPNIGKEHYYFNVSEAASVNSLFKNKKGLVTNVNAVYFHDREDRSTETVTEYMLPDSSRQRIHEDISNRLGSHRIELGVSFKKNKSKFFLNSDNFLYGDFSDMLAQVNGLDQRFRLSSFRAETRLSLVRRVGEKNGYNLYLRASYEHKPYELEVDSLSGSDTYIPYAGSRQQVVSDGLLVSTYTTFFHKLGFWGITLSPVVQADYRMNRLESALEGPWIMLDDASLYGNLMALHRFSVSPAAYLLHSSARWDLSLRIPLSYRMTFLDNGLGDDIQRHKVFVEPYLSVKYLASASVELAFRYNLQWKMPELSRLYQGFILTDYRSLSRYRVDLTEGMMQNFVLSLDYKDIFGMFFLGLRTGYSLGNPRILYGLDFDGIYSTTIAQHTSQNTHFVYGSLELGKSFSWKETVLKGTFSASYSENPYLMQDVIATSYGQSYSAALEFSFMPFRFLSFSYDGNVLYSLYRQEKGEGLNPLLTNSNRLGLKFHLPKNIKVNLGGNHYYNGASTDNQSFFLFDAGLEYSYKKFRWTLSCRNLLNVQQYVYSAISPIRSFETRYQIRPRMFFLKMAVSL